MKLPSLLRALFGYGLSEGKPRRRRSAVQGEYSAEILEDRVLPSATTVEPIDGTGNNVSHPTWGTAGTDLLRESPAAYANGINSPSLPNNPSARVVSDDLNNQSPSPTSTADIQTTDQNSLSDFGYA